MLFGSDELDLPLLWTGKGKMVTVQIPYLCYIWRIPLPKSRSTSSLPPPAPVIVIPTQRGFSAY